jgi:hypothetical protein
MDTALAVPARALHVKDSPNFLDRDLGSYFHPGVPELRMEARTMIKFPSANNLPETNRRPASPLSAEDKFRCVVHARGCILGGGRSANRSAAGIL